MSEISREFSCAAGNYSRGGNSCEYVVVHYTGGSGSARNVASWSASDVHESSYHYVLDGGGTVYQIMEDTDTAWAVGAWSGGVQDIRNDQSISVEVVNDGGAFTTDEVAELRWLVRLLMERHGIPAERVVRHYDCWGYYEDGKKTGGKQCPAYYVENASAWQALHETITGGAAMSASEVWGYQIANKKDGKQTNVEAWSLLTWTNSYAYDTQIKAAAMQKTLASMQKTLADVQKRVKAIEKAVG